MIFSNRVSILLLLTVFVLLTHSAIGGPYRVIANTGQWPSEVQAASPLEGGQLWYGTGHLRFTMVHPEDWAAISQHTHQDATIEDHPADPLLRWHAFDIRFVYPEPTATFLPTNPYPFYHNYIKGNNPANWQSHVPVYRGGMYRGIWPGIDMVWSQQDGHLKYNFEIWPGAAPEDIVLQYEGTTPRLREGKLIYTLPNEVTITEYIPEAYQWIDGEKHFIPVSYRVNGQQVSFAVGEYNPDYKLIIDPVLVFSTYTGSSADNFGFTATYDKNKLLYGGGLVFNPGYPVSNGAYQTTFAAVSDVGITKFNADGSQLIYSTYLGGNSCEIPNSLIATSNKELYILGLTSSTDFPTTASAYQSTFAGGTPVTYQANGTDFTNGTDIYIARLSPTGGALLSSTYLGGTSNDGINDAQNPMLPVKLNYNYGDLFRGEIVIGQNGHIYVATCTQSSNFPVSNNAFQPNFNGIQDAVVFSLTPDLSTLRWSTFLGGMDADAAYSLKMDGNNDVYVGGGTTSNNFPTTATAYQPAYLGGQADGFLLHLQQGGSTLMASTFIGTSEFDQNYFIEIDEGQDVYVVGQTEGSFPISAGTYSNPNSGQYIARFSPDLTQLQQSTVFGEGDGNPDISPTAMLIDRCNNVYVSGWGGSTNNFSQNADVDITGMPLTADAFQNTTDGSDFYFIVLSSNMDSLLYATYFGGGISAEHVDGGTSRFDRRGAIYQAVCAGCGANDDFPTTPGAWSSTNNSFNCNLGVVKFDLELARSEALAAITGATTGCAPVTVQFENKGSANAQYFWDFGDGTTSTDENPVHTFTTADTFNVLFTVRDTTQVCRLPDTTIVPVTVLDFIKADFTYTPQLVRFGEPVQFTDQSSPASSYYWQFGDGNTATGQNPVHTFENPGFYEVCLFIESNMTCFDTICKQIIIPIIDVPTAFSPNGDGHNDILYVKGIGVREFVFKLYNRWGELVFETTQLGKGWNGTVRGVPQEQEVYVYTLEAILENNEPFRKKGNITLLR